MTGRLPLLLLIAAFGCNGPFGLLPGGKLDGEPTPLPSDWTFAGDYGTAQVETRPEEPYSVNVVYTIVEGRLYVYAGGSETRWAEHIAADPLVRLRIEGALYDLRAERVTDADEIAAFGPAWTAQSMFRNDPADMEEVWLFRLVPR